jgi:hypothetical protein
MARKPEIITYEIILKQLFTSGSVIITNKNLDTENHLAFGE